VIHIETRSRLARSAIVDKAIRYFGTDGLGLEVQEQSACCVRFADSVGFVEVTLNSEEGSKRTRVGVIGREYEPQIKEFVKSL